MSPAHPHHLLRDPVSPARRRALGRLGLTVAMAYSAPAVIHLDRAYAKVRPSGCRGGGGGDSATIDSSTSDTSTSGTSGKHC